MTIKINHAKVVTASDAPSDAAAGRALKDDWNADLVIDASSYASDVEMLAGSVNTAKLMTPKQIKDAIVSIAPKYTTQNTTVAGITVGLDLSLGNMVTITDAITTDVQIGSITNMPLGWSQIKWAYATGKSIIFPNGLTYASEVQIARFFYDGVDYAQ